MFASDPDLDTPDAGSFYEIVNRQRPSTLAMIRRLKPAQGDGSRRVSTTAGGCPCVGDSYGAQSTLSLCAHHAEKVPLVGHAQVVPQRRVGSNDQRDREREGAASQVLIGSEYGIVGPSYAHGDAKDRRAERQMFATGHG